MKQILCKGTLGDTYIFCCKIHNMQYNDLTVWHNTMHKYWYQEITDIYRLVKKNSVQFVTEDMPYEEITSDVHTQNMNFFPNWRWPDGEYIEIPKPYIVVQPESGKPKGFNHKSLKLKTIQDIINTSGIPVVLLGTSPAYSYLRMKYNLIGETSLLEAMRIVSEANAFVGPEGLLSFVALSHKVESEIHYSSFDAINRRIIGSPWEKYCYELIHISDV